jgi:hypothetical protein
VPEESGRVVLQPNFHVFAFDPISDSVLARLDGFANRLNAERAIEYELTRESVYRAQLAGQNVAQITEWLAQVTGAGLPQNVARSLEEWQTAYERITVWPTVGWVQAAQPELIDQLLANAQIAPLILKRVTPTAVIVRPGAAGAVERALLDAGELPTRSARADVAQRGSIVVAEDGGITTAQASPSLYVWGALQPFTDKTEAGWRITPASVARGAAIGLSAETLIERLTLLAVDRVPAALQAQIKVWTGHFGTATISTVTLVRFRDQATLDELLQDPTLARLMKPFHRAAQLGLATVEGEDVATLRERLRKRGVEL